MGFEQFMQFGSGLAGVAGAGMSLLGGLGGMFQGRKNRKLARQLQQQQLDWQREENRLAFERSVEMWNMENAYNTPSEQMRRLVEAGLNPNLAYGNLGDATASRAPEYPATNVPSISDAAFTNPYDSLSRAGDAITQSSAVMSQAALNRANEKKVTQETVAEVIRNNMLPRTLEMELNNLTQVFANNKEILNEIKERANMLGKQSKLFEAQANQANQMAVKLGKELKLLDIDYFVRKATQDDVIKQIQAQARVSDEQARTITQRIAQELSHGHLSLQGLEKEIKMLSWDVSMRQAGLPQEFQNRMQALLSEGAEIDSAEVMSQAMKRISPEAAKRLIAHQTSVLGDLTYFASEIAVPLLQLVPKYQKRSSWSNKSQDNRGNSSSSSGSSNFTLSWD